MKFRSTSKSVQGLTPRSLVNTRPFEMSQLMKMNQRLLKTLSQTCKFYNARPTLLTTGPVRSYHDATASRPTPTAFSVIFADGPLEDIIASPAKSDPGVVQRTEALTKKVEKGLKTRRTKDAAVQRGSKEKGSTNLAMVAEKGTCGKNAVSSAATHEKSEIESREALEESSGPEQHLLQRDYPDTRTFDEAGLPSRTQKLEETLKITTERPARPPRPLSTYKEPWQVQKAALKMKFGDGGWNPRKKLSPDTMEGIRALHAQYPDQYTTPILAEQFAVTPEAIRRILKSKWSSNLDPDKAAERKERWATRHDRIWDVKSAIGLRPKRKGAQEVEDPDQFEEELRGRQLLETHRSG